jgi:hypothetical protein
MAIEPKKHQSDDDVPQAVVDAHTFAAREDIRPMDQREAEARFLDVLPDDTEEDAYDVYDTEDDMEADRAKRKKGLLNDAGEAETEDESEDDPEPEVEDDEGEESEDPDEDSLDGEVEEDEEDIEEEDGEPFYITSLDDLEGEMSGTVKVDGEETEVTLEELKSSYSFQAHNTKTAQKLAEEKRELDSAVVQLGQQRDRYAQGLEVLEGMMSRDMPAEPDWDKLEKENPQQFAVEQAKWQRRRQELADTQAEKDRVQREQWEAYQVERASVLEQETAKLLEVIPEWQDEEVFKEAQEDLVKYAVSQGFTEEEARFTDDSRIILLLRKAAAHDALQSKGQKVVKGKRVKKRQPATMKPGGGSSKRRRARRKPSASDARRRLAESGKLGDMSEALLNSDLLD